MHLENEQDPDEREWSKEGTELIPHAKPKVPLSGNHRRVWVGSDLKSHPTVPVLQPGPEHFQGIPAQPLPTLPRKNSVPKSHLTQEFQHPIHPCPLAALSTKGLSRRKAPLDFFGCLLDTKVEQPLHKMFRKQSVISSCAYKLPFLEQWDCWVTTKDVY